MRYRDFLWKDVRVTCDDGQVLEGYVDLYTSALDNEPDPESICLKIPGEEGVLTEIYTNEIKKIEVIE